VINVQVRPADISDRQRLSNLIFFETRSHRHLDWRQPLDWLGDKYFWMAETGSQVTAALICSEETDGIAWVRLFVHAGYWSAENAWTMLWSTARDEIMQSGGAKVGVIVQHTWFKKVLEFSGFETQQGIVNYERLNQLSVLAKADGIRIRPMTEADLPEVAAVDAEAFAPLWRNSEETLRVALSLAVSAMVAENEAGVVGYQVTTGNGMRAHLARLAVSPQVQRRGVGRALLQNLFTFAERNGYVNLTVNTQSDNLTSMKLYEGTGFRKTGEMYPVYTFDVPAYS